MYNISFYNISICSLHSKSRTKQNIMIGLRYLRDEQTSSTISTAVRSPPFSHPYRFPEYSGKCCWVVLHFPLMSVLFFLWHFLLRRNIIQKFTSIIPTARLYLRFPNSKYETIGTAEI